MYNNYKLTLVDGTSSRITELICCVEQIRCKNTAVCNRAGTTIVVTDIHTDKTNTTDFVLSSRAFRAMALPGKDTQVLQLGITEVEYKR